MTHGISAHDWLPGPLTAGTEMPLSVDELQELYASNLILTEEDVAQLLQTLPYLGDVLSPGQFRTFVLRAKSTPQAAVSNQTEANPQHTVAAVADLCGSSSAQVVLSLRKAVCDLSPEAYEAAYSKLADLSGKREAFRRRNLLIARLAQGAPNWAAAVAARKGVHGGGSVPGDPSAAWHWRQTEQG